MRNKRLDAIFALGQLQGIKLAIETTILTDQGKKITAALQDCYDCLNDHLMENKRLPTRTEAIDFAHDLLTNKAYVNHDRELILSVTMNMYEWIAEKYSELENDQNGA